MKSTWTRFLSFKRTVCLNRRPSYLFKFTTDTFLETVLWCVLATLDATARSRANDSSGNAHAGIIKGPSSNWMLVWSQRDVLKGD